MGKKHRGPGKKTGEPMFCGKRGVNSRTHTRSGKHKKADGTVID